MNALRRIVLLVLWGLAVAWPVEAANHYVRAAATGTASGADWTNAYTSLPASLTRGDTYYVAAGGYPSHIFSDAVSGTSVITVQAATIADHGTDTGWSDTYQGQASWSSTAFHVWYVSTGYYTFNGVYGSGPGTTTYGFRLDKSPTVVTGCGSTAGNALQMDFGPSNIIVQFVEVKGTGVVAADPNNVDDYAWQIKGSNHNLNHNWVHDQGGGWALLDGTTNVTIESNTFRNSHSTPACHAGGILFRLGNTNITLRYNTFENADGTGYLETPVSSSTTNNNWYIYGNIFSFNAGDSNGQASAGGVIQAFGIDITGDFFFYNNTISALDRGPANSGVCGFVFSSLTIQTFTVRDNLWYNCRNAVNRVGSGGGVTITTVVWTHNAYYDTATTDPDTDKQVSTGNPFVNVSQFAGGTNFHLVSATTAGMTLPSPYTTDPDGVTRGTDGSWDRGAYEIGGGATSVPGPPGGGGKAPTRRRR